MGLLEKLLIRRPHIGPRDCVQIEACTLCQLDCRNCPMRKADYGARGRGYLKCSDFVKFLDLNPSIRHVELANNGEIFLNPELPEIIRRAFQRNVGLSAWTGTNFNHVSDDAIDAMVQCGFNPLTIAIDGACQDSYSWYRRNGNFDRVIENIKRLNAKKAELKSEFPRLTWQYVILPSNHSLAQIRKARDMAAELGMDIVFIKDHGGFVMESRRGFVPENRAEVEAETGLSYTDNIASSAHRKRYVPCSQLWHRLQINWDGRAVGCCMNIERDFGANMFETPVDKFMNSKIMRGTRKMLTGGDVCKESPCRECIYYKRLAASGKYLDERDVSESAA